MGLHQHHLPRSASNGPRAVRRSRQRGLSFIGLVFLAVFAVAAFAIGGQSVPIFLEYQAIRKAAAKAAREASTVPEVRASFDRAAAIDNIRLHLRQGPRSDEAQRQDRGLLQLFARDRARRPRLPRVPFPRADQLILFFLPSPFWFHPAFPPCRTACSMPSPIHPCCSGPSRTAASRPTTTNA